MAASLVENLFFKGRTHRTCSKPVKGLFATCLSPVVSLISNGLNCRRLDLMAGNR